MTAILDLAPVRIGAEMVRCIDLSAGSARHDDAWGWGCRGVWAGGTRVCTGVAGWLGGEACKGFRLAAALAPWGRGLPWRRARGNGVAGPHPLEHDAQPHQG